MAEGGARAPKTLVEVAFSEAEAAIIAAVKEASHMDYQMIAKETFDNLQDHGPVEAPRWDELHPVERDHLTRFAEALLKQHAASVQ